MQDRKSVENDRAGNCRTDREHREKLQAGKYLNENVGKERSCLRNTVFAALLCMQLTASSEKRIYYLPTVVVNTFYQKQRHSVHNCTCSISFPGIAGIRAVSCPAFSELHRMTVTSFANNFLWSCCRRHFVGQLNRRSTQFSESLKDTCRRLTT